MLPGKAGERAHGDVVKLLAELHAIAAKRGIPRIDEISDSIECLSRAYALSGLEQNASETIAAELGLTPRERRLFRLLFARTGRTVNKNVVYDAIYFDEAPGDLPDAKILDIFICKLRKKIFGSRYAIETDRALGWRLTEREN